MERSHTSSLTAHLKALDKKEASIAKCIRSQGVIKVWFGIKNSQREQYKESVKQRDGFLRK